MTDQTVERSLGDAGDYWSGTIRLVLEDRVNNDIIPQAGSARLSPRRMSWASVVPQAERDRALAHGVHGQPHGSVDKPVRQPARNHTGKARLKVDYHKVDGRWVDQLQHADLAQRTG